MPMSPSQSSVKNIIVAEGMLDLGFTSDYFSVKLHFLMISATGALTGSS
jgi:hypothetical protein